MVKKTDNTDLTGGASVPKKLTPDEIMAELGIPVTRRGEPNMRDFQPKRFVRKEESEQRGFSWFYDGSSCRAGHMAAKRTSNPAICSDCERTKASEETIYGKAKHQTFTEVKPGPKQKVADPNNIMSLIAPTPEAPKLSVQDTKFLEHYARERSLENAAKAAGTTKELILARRAGFKLLDEAMSKLEADLSIPSYVPPSHKFEWDDDKRDLFVETYGNTGLIEKARDAVGCTQMQLHRELESNTQFKYAVESCQSIASQVVYDSLLKSAIGGQQQSLAKWLELQKEQTERLAKEHALSPEQMRAEVRRLLTGMESAGIRVTCPHPEGQQLTVTTNDGTVTVCEVCSGSRFTPNTRPAA